MALDYPAYGNSSVLPHSPSISDYASAAQAVANDLYPKQTLDFLGFHTGCLVATEVSINYPDSVNQLVLIDSPYFDEQTQAELLASRGQAVELKPELTMLESAWEFCVTKKLEHISLDRAYQMFVDHIQTGRNTNQAFAAAFSYPCDSRFAQVAHKTHVVATKSGLYHATIETANRISSAQLHELTEIDAAVLDRGAEIVAAKVLALLD